MPAGVTYALAAIFSTGQRKQLLPFASQMWTDAAQLLNSRSAASSVVARKYATKLVQRIGLTFLPATAAAWRYQQTSVSINESLSSINSNKPAAEAAPAESPPQPSLSQPKPEASDGSCSSNTAAGAVQQHQSYQSLAAHGMTNDESARPALQPSPLVNASPVTSPTPKAHMHASDRPPVGATNAPHSFHVADAASCQPGSSVPPAWNNTACNRQMPGAEDPAAGAAEGSHESVVDGGGSSADGDCDDDIPEEIEEVCSLFVLGPPPTTTGSWSLEPLWRLGSVVVMPPGVPWFRVLQQAYRFFSRSCPAGCNQEKAVRTPPTQAL